MKIPFLIFTLFLTSQTWAQPLFTDATLKTLLTTSQKGLIFVWSPLMPLSVLAREEVLSIGQELGLDLTVLVDPHFHEGGSDPLMVSNELLNLGMLNHFPALVLYKNQTLHSWMLQGYEDKLNLKKLISEQLELK